MHSLTSHISYIGADDDNLDLFEGQYPLSNGISYNSYFIADEHPAIVDTVDMRRCDDWLSNLEHAVEKCGRRPEYLIVQHMEPDHSGSLGEVLKRYPELKVVSTAKAAAMMAQYFEGLDLGGRHIAVGDGDSLELGRSTLRFVTAPMVHWPEVMMTVCEPEGVLFSADAFGTFAMSGSNGGWPDEARRYYTNIVGRFGANVQAAIKKLGSLKFDTIAPLHGPVLTGDLTPYLRLYDHWSRYQAETRGVLVAYASVYGGTAHAARQLAIMLEEANAGEVELLDLSRHHLSHAVAEAFRLSGMVLCSVTYDGALFPPMAHFIHHLQIKRLSHRKVGLLENGSWAPQAARLMTNELATMTDMEIVQPVVTIRSRMHSSDETSMRALAQAMARALTSRDSE